MSDPYFGVHYFSNELSKDEKNLDKFRKKFYEIPIVPFTIEEHLVLREILLNMTTNARLLIEEVAKLPKTEPKSFWRKILDKI